MKKLLLSLFLFSSVATANVQDVVKLSGPYAVDRTQAQNSVVHFYLPTNSVASIGLSGGDTFDKAKDNINGITTDITDNGYTVYINNSISPGDSSVVGINTHCGLTLSVVIHSLEKTTKPDQIRPKLSISATGCPEIQSKLK
ncbi:hypothetical protein [Enterovibrio sp. FF113]|uniref:hypothetical protein n=1 Tax=Enterovibrio sp. FF113 TaxID=3230010 RepID=UPI00352D6540